MEMFLILMMISLASCSFEARFFSKFFTKLSEKRKERISKRHRVSTQEDYVEQNQEELETTAEGLPEEAPIIETDIVSDEEDYLRNKENHHLIELARTELAAGNLETSIDCLIAAIFNTDDEEQIKIRQKECINLCRRTDTKTGEKVKTKLILADALEGSFPDKPEEIFQKAKKYSAERKYTKARDLLLSLYLAGSGNRFDYVRRCGMISMKQRKFYLARGFFLIASKLINEQDPEWVKIIMKIARCEELINKNSPKANSLVRKVIRLRPNYKPIDEEEKKLFDSIKEID